MRSLRPDRWQVATNETWICTEWGEKEEILSASPFAKWHKWQIGRGLLKKDVFIQVTNVEKQIKYGVS